VLASEMIKFIFCALTKVGVFLVEAKGIVLIGLILNWISSANKKTLRNKAY
jgi:hypothetical protein